MAQCQALRLQHPPVWNLFSTEKVSDDQLTGLEGVDARRLLWLFVTENKIEHHKLSILKQMCVYTQTGTRVPSCRSRGWSQEPQDSSGHGQGEPCPLWLYELLSPPSLPPLGGMQQPLSGQCKWGAHQGGTTGVHLQQGMPAKQAQHRGPPPGCLKPSRQGGRTNAANGS